MGPHSLAKLAFVFLCTILLGCTTQEREPVIPKTQPKALKPGEVRRFSYRGLKGEVISSAAFRGRMTLIAFVASYDTASQAQVRYLKQLYRRHVPRINLAVLVLEPEHHRPLVQAFAEALQLPFPVAMADAATIQGKGPFAGMQHVPAAVLLDRDSREVWRGLGLKDSATLSAIVASADPHAR